MIDVLGASLAELLDHDRLDVIDRAVSLVGGTPPHSGCVRDSDLMNVSPRIVVVDQFGPVEADLRLRKVGYAPRRRI